MRHKKLPYLLGISILVAVLSFFAMNMAFRKEVLSAPGTVTGLSAASAGRNRVLLSWDPVSGAEGYLVYGKKDGEYGYVGMTTKGTTFADTNALASDYNFYWVFAYIKDGSGKMIIGGCEKYVYAKGVCAAVTNLKATAQYYSVKICWDPSYSAEGYLVYGKTETGKYGYKGMTTQGTTWTDSSASLKEYNFYWVYPYYKDASGKMVVGLTGKYTYGRAREFKASVTGLKAESKVKYVQLTWDKVPSAEGYIIYRKIGDGDFEYRYIVSRTDFQDTTANYCFYNYYRVYPYITVNGKKVLGPSTTYVYARPWAASYVFGSVTAYLDDNGILVFTGNGAIPDMTAEYYYLATGSPNPIKCPWRYYIIKKVVIGPGITSIGEYAFQYCQFLETVDLSNAKSLREIRSYAFAMCFNLEEVIIPSGKLQSIGKGAFEYTCVKNVVIGEGLKTIDSTAFYGSLLESLTLPASFEKIIRSENESEVFQLEFCDCLREINIAPGSKKYYSVDGVLYRKVNGENHLANYPKARSATSFAIPSDVKVIGCEAFKEQQYLETVYIPDSVVKVEAFAFSCCPNLQIVTGMKNVEVIECAGFQCGPKLKSIPVLTNVKEIGGNAFMSCPLLTSVKFGSKLETIGASAFYNTGIKSVQIPSSIKYIEGGAFPDTAAVVVPNGVYKMEDGCYIKGWLQSITGTRCYDIAFEMLEIVNEIRAYMGADPLTMDRDLLETAMFRGAEIAISFSHTRPSQMSCFTACRKMSGENIAHTSWKASAETIVSFWCNSQGHFENIVNPKYKSIGIGVFICNGETYAVQCFGFEEATPVKQRTNYTLTEKVVIRDEI